MDNYFDNWIDSNCSNLNVIFRNKLKTIQSDLEYLENVWISRNTNKKLFIISDIRRFFNSYVLEMFTNNADDSLIILGSYILLSIIDFDDLKPPRYYLNKNEYIKHIESLKNNWNFLKNNYAIDISDIPDEIKNLIKENHNTELIFRQGI